MSHEYIRRKEKNQSIKTFKKMIKLFQMSFSWSTSSISSFPGMKSAPTNSFADALKRLAEHVEEKNKNIETNNTGNSSSVLVQSSADIPNNRINPSYVNNSVPPEQALRLYTQYMQEAERREDIRRSYLRSYNGSDGPNMILPMSNRRLDAIDPFRFLAPHLSNPLHPSVYLQSLSPQNRIAPSSLFFSNIKSADTIAPRLPTSNIVVEKKSEQSSKPKSKLFRPYELDSPTSTIPHSSSPTTTKKSLPSPSTFPNSTPVFLEATSTSTSSGKEKQLFNSLGLVQQSTDIPSDQSSSSRLEPSPVVSTNEDSISNETMTTFEENNGEKSHSARKESSSPIRFKRKSISPTKLASNRKQSKIDTIQNTVP